MQKDNEVGEKLKNKIIVSKGIHDQSFEVIKNLSKDRDLLLKTI